MQPESRPCPGSARTWRRAASTASPTAFNDVLRPFRGRPILTTAQVEDVVAFLETLK